MKTFLKNNPVWLGTVLLSGFACVLLAFRVVYTEKIGYVFLVWNAFLAIIPLLFIELANKHNKWIFFALCLLFLPNAPYLITDLFHLKPHKIIPLWYDTLLLFAFSMAGLVAFYGGLLKMEVFLNKKVKNRIYTGFAVASIIFLCAFGVYLGRFLRFNSWDIISNPFSLLAEIADRFIHPLSHPRTWGVTLGYGSLFLLGFGLIKWWSNWVLEQQSTNTQSAESIIHRYR